MTLDLKPLNSKQIHDKIAVKNAYSDFWNHIKFKKGWETPRIKLHEVSGLLDEAAEIVVRIRSALDSSNSLFKVRMIDGSARELLWDKCLEREDDALENKDEFVRDIVHATFKDASGYVENLNEEVIDKYIQQIQNWKRGRKEIPKELVEQIKSSWKSLQSQMDDLLSLDVFQDEEKIGQLSENENQFSSLKSILKQIDNLNTHASELAIQYKEQAPVLPATEPMVEDITDYKTKEEQEPQAPERDYCEHEELLPEPVETENTTENSNNYTTEDQSTLQVEEMPNIKITSNEDEILAIKDKQAQTNSQEQTDNSELPDVEESQQESQQDIELKDAVDEDQSLQNQNTSESTESEESKKQKEEEEKVNNNALLKIKVVAEDVSNVKNGITHLHESADRIDEEDLHPENKKTLVSLQKKCMAYTEQLLRDLMSLDEIVNTPEARPLRKQQVKEIQQMMEDVDSLNGKLKKFIEKVTVMENEQKKKMEEEEEKRKEEEKKLEEEKKAALKAKAVDMSDRWKQMRLKPKFDIKEAKDAYLISSYIPGVRKEDIDISLGNNKRTLTVAGLRLPSEEDYNQLQKAVRRNVKSEDDIETLLLKAGAGRFGRFEETYELPANVDPDGITGGYDRGVLTVSIPKIKRPSFASELFGRPAKSASPFYSDRDFWW